MKIARAPRARNTTRNEHQQRVLDGVRAWAAYYRANIHRFVEDYLHIKLKLFQIFLLAMMDWANLSVIVAARGIGKSYICAVYCCARAVLYPGQI